MQISNKGRILALTVLAMIAAAALTMIWRPSRGQSQTAFKASRTADGKPNLNGIWQAVNTANWDIEAHSTLEAPFVQHVGIYLTQPAGLSVVEGGAIPYKPEALEQKRKHFASRLDVDPFIRETGDPEAKCFSPGVPRSTYMPFPFQIIQSTNMILIAYEYARSPRPIYMGPLPPVLRNDPLGDNWMGNSTGHWEGETLVVDVTALNGKAWLDRAGNFYSDKAHVVERYTPISPDHLRYEATIDDPAVFTRPWKMSMPLYRRIDNNMQLLPFECVSLSEPFVYKKYRKPSSD